MKPESHLREARHHISQVLDTGDVPPATFHDLLQMRAEIDDLIETTEQWRQFVGDVEEVEE